MTDIRLVPLDQYDREQFILDNQEAFNYGALEEFGMRDDHPRSTARGSAMLPGVRSNGFIRRWRSGRRLHRISKQETFIST